jgi:hypothetical protein
MYHEIALYTQTTIILLQPLRFFALFFTVLLGPPCDDVAVVTADRVSPLPARGGKLGIFSAHGQ